jgi:hypothetical protein
MSYYDMKYEISMVGCLLQASKRFERFLETVK